MARAKLMIEVRAGIIPGEANKELTRRWTITDEEWADEATRRDTWDRVHGHAREYASRLMNPNHNNWVDVAWVWL